MPTKILLWPCLVLAFLAACGADQGEPCQEQDDCSSGLMCCKPTAGISVRGTCESVCDMRRPTPDSGAPDAAPVDASGGDAEADASPDGASDGAGGDAANGDAATDAAGRTDAEADSGMMG